MVPAIQMTISPNTDKGCSRSTPEGVARSYYVQRIRLNPDWTRLAMVHQPTFQVHILLCDKFVEQFASSRYVEKTLDGMNEIL